MGSLCDECYWKLIDTTFNTARDNNGDIVSCAIKIGFADKIITGHPQCPHFLTYKYARIFIGGVFTKKNIYDEMLQFKSISCDVLYELITTIRNTYSDNDNTLLMNRLQFIDKAWDNFSVYINQLLPLHAEFRSYAHGYINETFNTLQLFFKQSLNIDAMIHLPKVHILDPVIIESSCFIFNYNYILCIVTKEPLPKNLHCLMKEFVYESAL